MKLWSSFVKELTIASRGFYFYIEIFMAAILLFVLLFVVPEHFTSKEDEYIYLEFSLEQVEEIYINALLETDLDGKTEEVELKVENGLAKATLYETDEKKLYVLEEKEDMIYLAEKKHKISTSVIFKDNKFYYTYYTQGNETKKLNNLLYVLHGDNDLELKDVIENQEVRKISTDYIELTDRENLLPAFLTFNGSLMGLFIIAAYIFLDKKEGVIKAYAITPSPVWKYLMSKLLVLTTTSIITSLIMVIPVMGTRINYLLLLAFLIPTGFFASSLGLLIAGFYDDLSKSFGIMYLLMLSMALPILGYYIPSWDPTWLKFIPSYFITFGFKEILIKGDTGYILLISLGYLVVSAILFAFANMRYKRTLSV